MTNHTLELTYIAGLFDGEGSISIHRNKNRHGNDGFRHQVTISQNDRRVLDMIQRQWGGRVIDRKDGCHTYRVPDALLYAIEPFLVVKQEAAQLMLDYLKTMRYVHNNTRRREYQHKIQVANRRYGSSPLSD